MTVKEKELHFINPIFLIPIVFSMYILFSCVSLKTVEEQKFTVLKSSDDAASYFLGIFSVGAEAAIKEVAEWYEIYIYGQRQKNNLSFLDALF